MTPLHFTQTHLARRDRFRLSQFDVQVLCLHGAVSHPDFDGAVQFCFPDVSQASQSRVSVDKVAVRRLPDDELDVARHGSPLSESDYGSLGIAGFDQKVLAGQNELAQARQTSIRNPQTTLSEHALHGHNGHYLGQWKGRQSFQL